jgi:hypothetical protein
MNYVECTCGLAFTDSPILALLEHRRREHCARCRGRLAFFDQWEYCPRCDRLRVAA